MDTHDVFDFDCPEYVPVIDEQGYNWGKCKNADGFECKRRVIPEEIQTEVDRCSNTIRKCFFTVGADDILNEIREIKRFIISIS